MYTTTKFILLAISMSFMFGTSSCIRWGPRKVDCAVSGWTDWERHLSGHVSRLRETCIRTRMVMRRPRLGGEACPHLSETKKCPAGSSRDLLFLIDTSDSVSAKVFQKVKADLVKMIELTCGSIGEGDLDHRIAVVSFSSSVKLHFNFQTHWNMKDMKDAIMKIPQDGGKLRCLGDAVKFAHTHVHLQVKMMYTTTKFILLAISLSCMFGTTGCIRGIRWGSRKVNCAVSVWTDWEQLNANECIRTRMVMRRPRLGGRACPHLSETKQCPAGLPRDLLFIIDTSGSMSATVFHKVKANLVELIEVICGSIGEGDFDHRIAVVSFSSSVKLHFNFKTHRNMNDVKDAIMKIPQDGGNHRCLGDAIKFAHTQALTSTNGIRSLSVSVKEVLILTAGQSNCGVEIAKNLRELQAKAFVFALAIGLPNRREIQTLVSKPLKDHIFSLSNFIKLDDMVSAVVNIPNTCVPFELS